MSTRQDIFLILVIMLGVSGMAQAKYLAGGGRADRGQASYYNIYEVSEVDSINSNINGKIESLITSSNISITAINTKLTSVGTDITNLKTDNTTLKTSIAEKASAKELAGAKKALSHLSQRFDVYDTFNKNNSCDKCLNWSEKDLDNLVKKLKCFSDEINLYEKDQKQWSVSCTARTVGYTKKILLLLKAERGQLLGADNKLSDHLDDVYPYYNVISVNEVLGSKQ